MTLYWHSVFTIAVTLLCVCSTTCPVLSQENDTKQDRSPEYFFHGMLSEATTEVSKRDAKFMLFLYATEDSLTGYYLDTLFLDNDIAAKLQRNFVCIAADTSSAKGNTLVRQFGVSDFPSVLFVDRKGQEFYSISGRIELDQMFDICERALFE